jgi:hypothetical protein
MYESDAHQNDAPIEPEAPVRIEPLPAKTTWVVRRLRIKISDILSALAIIISVGAAGLGYQQLS